MHTDLIAIDFETTGLNPAVDTILSIGVVTSTGATFRRYVNPPRTWLGLRKKVGADACKVNGYCPALWAQRGAVEEAQAAASLALFLRTVKKEGARRPLAHNAGFDRSFLDALSRRTGVVFDIGHRWECSMASLAFAQRAGIAPRGPCSLDHLAEISGQDRPEIHDALADAQVCLTGYQHLVNLAKQPQPHTHP